MPIIGIQFADRHTGAIVSREQLLELIEKNNGPEGLDLEGKDFSGIRLGETSWTD